MYDTFQKANSKGADQTARMRRLVCAFVVRNPRRQVFSRCGPNGKQITPQFLMKRIQVWILKQLYQKGVKVM